VITPPFFLAKDYVPDLEIESDEMRASWTSLVRRVVKWSKGVNGDGQHLDLTNSFRGRVRKPSEVEVFLALRGKLLWLIRGNMSFNLSLQLCCVPHEIKIGLSN